MVITMRAIQKKNLLNKSLFFVCLIFMCACSRTGEVYNAYINLPAEGWNKKELQKFSTGIEDSVGLYRLTLMLRYSNDYDYSNLWLFVRYTDSLGVIRTDTVNCILADEFGKWKGSGWGSLYQQEIVYKESFKFPLGENSFITVQQGMRDDVITGVADIGLKIDKINY